MYALFFYTSVFCLIFGTVLATMGDELGSLWRRFIDRLHPSPAERDFIEIKKSLVRG